MKQLRYLQEISLYKLTPTVQNNGETTYTSTLVSTYLVQPQELTSDVDATIYGAEINNMLRLSSVRYTMETYLRQTMNFTSDNISLYRIKINSLLYRIKVVREKWVDIVLEGTYVPNKGY